jgi:hypothetical protein
VMKRLLRADSPTNMLSESCLIESTKFINGVCRSMAPVVKETLYGVLNFDGMQTSDVHEQLLDRSHNYSSITVIE